MNRLLLASLTRDQHLGRAGTCCEQLSPNYSSPSRPPRRLYTINTAVQYSSVNGNNGHARRHRAKSKRATPVMMYLVYRACAAPINDTGEGSYLILATAAVPLFRFRHYASKESPQVVLASEALHELVIKNRFVELSRQPTDSTSVA